jgi:tripartite-type tricarboxylate transporter receptor subunit TctC
MNDPHLPHSPRIQACAFAAVLAMFACNTSAQTAYPSKSIRILIPFPPGGSTDFLARGIGQKITEAWGQQVVIDNRGGAAGIVATDIVAKAAPDGYTLLMNAISHAANASLYRKLPYDTLRDFAPVTSVADVPIILVVRSQLNVSSAAELIALARAKPGQITFAAGGVGASSHLAGELFRSAAKIEWQTVQYKGGGPALIDLLGGQVDLMFSPIASSIQYIKAGRLKALGVTSAKRVPLMPDLPTIAESGLPGYESSAWYGMVAPARVPRDIILKLNREINDLLRNPQFRDAMIARGAIPMGGSTEEFSEFIRQEVKKYATLVKESGIRAE